MRVKEDRNVADLIGSGRPSDIDDEAENNNEVGASAREMWKPARVADDATKIISSDCACVVDGRAVWLAINSSAKMEILLAFSSTSWQIKNHLLETSASFIFVVEEDRFQYDT
ncbi:hypothetical protein PIB30_070987 [Stylosanthes scabra]|uniref:Uncharacterized protein n=1 Tax=Stylosanthes scabra TaxID=79078 RepID=A0ABU6WRH2_9FABA|nr:hypothetical protein [Stylosanthes scabra]